MVLVWLFALSIISYQYVSVCIIHNHFETIVGKWLYIPLLSARRILRPDRGRSGYSLALQRRNREFSTAHPFLPAIMEEIRHCKGRESFFSILFFGYENSHDCVYPPCDRRFELAPRRVWLGTWRSSLGRYGFRGIPRRLCISRPFRALRSSESQEFLQNLRRGNGDEARDVKGVPFKNPLDRGRGDFS